MGGWSDGWYVSEVLLYDTKLGGVLKVEFPAVFELQCFTKPTLLTDGSIMAVISDENMMGKLIRITYQEGQIDVTVLYTIGHRDQ